VNLKQFNSELLNQMTVLHGQLMGLGQTVRSSLRADRRRAPVSGEKGRSMPQAIVDPGELRRFAVNLKQFNSELLNQMTVLHGQLMGLGQTWRDREHDKFVEEFEQTLIVIKRFVEATNQHVPFLMRKAERVEEYLQQR